MTRRDNLLERLEQVNPVPDPSRLYEDIETSRHFYLSDEQRRDKTMTGTKIGKATPGPKGPRVRRGLVIGAAAAAVVIIVGVVAFAFVDGDDTDVAGSDSRVVQLTFDGEQCTYEGPSVLSAGQGQVEVVYHNESAEDAWFFFGRLDEGKTTQDMIDDIAENPTRSTPPSWTVNVWNKSKIPADSSTTPVPRTVTPGVHNLVCGSETPPYAYFGGELTVTP